MFVRVLLLAAIITAAAAENYKQVTAQLEAHPSQPYAFSYNTDDEFGNTHFHKETSDGKGRVEGSYGYRDAHGTERVVQYVADEHGYRAHVKTNEPGTDNENPANAEFLASPIELRLEPIRHHVAQPHEKKSPHYPVAHEKLAAQQSPASGQLQRLPAYPLRQAAQLRRQPSPSNRRAANLRRQEQQAILQNAALLRPLAHIIF